MSRFLNEKYAALAPYIPGEQPKVGEYIKLNTNESPFPPPPSVVKAVEEEAGRLALYSDPENTRLTEKAAEILGVKPTEILMTNGSDEGLNFAFMAFCANGVAFPDISYGFYSVFAELHRIPYRTVPLKADFSVDYKDYLGVGKTVLIANPNAPTGLCLSIDEVEEIVKSNPDNIVIIDEAYVDFGGESAVKLIEKYDNLLVTQTFSKSRSLAGARLGMVIGKEGLIADLKRIQYSTNPYNVNRMTAAAGYAALCEKDWFNGNIQAICNTRETTKKGLEALGFTVLPSKSNFLFAKSDKIAGEKLYEKLKSRGVLVRHFAGERIKEFNRITVGTQAQMDILLKKIKEILSEEEK